MATEPAAISEGPTPSEEPEVTPDVPVEETAAPDAPTDGQAETEPETEPTSVEAAAPPAFDLTDPNIAFIVEKYGDDPNTIARELHALNNRMAEQSRQAPSTAPPRDEPRAAHQPVDEPEIVRQALSSAHQDPECISLKGQYQRVGKQIEAIATFDGEELVGGRVVEVDQQITKLGRTIEFFKEAISGSGPFQLDEFQKTDTREKLKDAKEELRDLKENRQDLVDQYNRLSATRKSLSDKFQKRYEEYRDRISGQVRTERAQKQEEQEVKVIQQSFTKEWTAALEATFTALKIPNDPQLRAELKLIAKEKGQVELASGKVIPTGGSRAFIEKVFKKELDRGDYWKRKGVGTYAGQKRGDVRPQAPSGRAAVAPEDPANSTNWKDRWGAMARGYKEKFGGSAKEVFERATGRPTV